MSLWVFKKLQRTNKKMYASACVNPGSAWQVQDISSPFEADVLLRNNRLQPPLPTFLRRIKPRSHLAVTKSKKQPQTPTKTKKVRKTGTGRKGNLQTVYKQMYRAMKTSFIAQIPFNGNSRGLDAFSRKLACADTLNGILLAYESFPEKVHQFNDALDSHLGQVERDEKLRNREQLNIALRKKISGIKQFYQSIRQQPKSNSTWKYQHFFKALSVGNLKRISGRQSLKNANEFEIKLAAFRAALRNHAR